VKEDLDDPSMKSGLSVKPSGRIPISLVPQELIELVSQLGSLSFISCPKALPNP
jgi:hypothetical protein